MDMLKNDKHQHYEKAWFYTENVRRERLQERGFVEQTKKHDLLENHHFAAFNRKDDTIVWLFEIFDHF